MRVWVDIVHSHPHAELAESGREVVELGLERAIAPRACGIADIEAIGGGILADHQQLFHPSLDELFGLAHHVAGRSADEVPA